jgi:hypothetical protein
MPEQLKKILFITVMLIATLFSGCISTSEPEPESAFIEPESIIWTGRDVPGSIDTSNWLSITSSSDGMRLAAVVWEGYIYTSADGGKTWIERTEAGNRLWYSITSSSDGMSLAAVVWGGYIYTSADGGKTWTEQTEAESKNWKSITSSSDGMRLAAVIWEENNIFTGEY